MAFLCGQIPCKNHRTKLGILICGMHYAACGQKNRAYNNRLSATPYVQFLVCCRMRYAMRKNESLHVAIHGAWQIRMVNPENDVTDRGFSMNVGGNSGSVMMPSSKVSTENMEKFIELVR